MEKHDKLWIHLGEFNHTIGEQKKTCKTCRPNEDGRAMKHTVMGIYEGDDFASYENVLPIKSEELAVLMGWKDQEDYVYDYQLTKDQITAIEQACSVSFPSDLILFLTTSQN